MKPSKHTQAVTLNGLRSVLQDPDLSLAAKGVLAIVLTHRPGTVITRAELFESNRDPMHVIDAAIRELACGGFIATVAPAKRSVGRRSGGIRVQPKTPAQESPPRFGNTIIGQPSVSSRSPLSGAEFVRFFERGGDQ